MKRRIILTVIVLLITSFVGVSAQKIQLNSPEIKEVLKKNNAIVVLDVRTADEFAAGHLKGAINIDIRQQDAYSKLDKLNRTITYVVYCRTNHRSGTVLDYMMQKGFGKVYQMMDGFTGWAANNFVYEK